MPVVKEKALLANTKEATLKKKKKRGLKTLKTMCSTANYRE